MPMFRQAALAAFNEGPAAATVILNKIGMLGRNSVVEAITDPEPPFVPLRPATIRNRLRRTQAGRRQLKRLQANARAAGISTQQALQDWATSPTAAGGLFIQPLIDTGQLRRAITYVVQYNPGSVSWHKAVGAATKVGASLTTP
jgi:hypothetical protein